MRSDSDVFGTIVSFQGLRSIGEIASWRIAPHHVAGQKLARGSRDVDRNGCPSHGPINVQERGSPIPCLDRQASFSPQAASTHLRHVYIYIYIYVRRLV